jgi:hypothetical protein
MTRKDAYVWLSAMLQAPLSQTHIGYLSEYYCRQVIEESKRLLENRLKIRERSREFSVASGGEIYAVK